jgi:hypothetical protein
MILIADKWLITYHKLTMMTRVMLHLDVNRQISQMPLLESQRIEAGNFLFRKINSALISLKAHSEVLALRLAVD